jgi:hypothetical protein
MLSLGKFTDKIADLMAWYINFNFGDLYFEEDDGERIPTLRTQMWYEAFKDFDDNDFEAIVDKYMKENVYPPSSPANLLEFANKKLVEMNKSNANNAWGELERLITIHGFSSHYTLNKDGEKVYVSGLKNALEKHQDQKLYKVYQIMSEKLRGITDFNKQFVMKEFLEEYNTLLLQEIKDTTSQGKIDLNQNQGKKLLK